VPEVNRVLGAGTSQHGLHMQVVVVPPRGRYLPGKDTPIYGDNLGPHCYRAPFTGIHLNDGTTSGSGAKTSARTTAKTGARTTASTKGTVDGELTSLWLGQPPSSVPSWASLLTAPLFRGMDVTLRASRA
jgi:phospholipid/cholesterol/gamma-HCH transport system substrate-binding protein